MAGLRKSKGNLPGTPTPNQKLWANSGAGAVSGSQMQKRVSVQTDADSRTANGGVNLGVWRSEGTEPTSLSPLGPTVPEDEIWDQSAETQAHWNLQGLSDRAVVKTKYKNNTNAVFKEISDKIINEQTAKRLSKRPGNLEKQPNRTFKNKNISLVALEKKISPRMG